MRIPHVLATLVLAVPLVGAAGIESIAPRDSVEGLKTALDQGATRAVARLGVKDGFLRSVFGAPGRQSPP